MKVPDKNKGMKKYMVLFCIVLVSIVVSTVLAGYVGTKDVVDDIPTKVQNQFQIMPEWKKLEEQTNLTLIRSFLDNGMSVIECDYIVKKNFSFKFSFNL